MRIAFGACLHAGLATNAARLVDEEFVFNVFGLNHEEKSKVYLELAIVGASLAATAEVAKTFHTRIAASDAPTRKSVFAITHLMHS